MTAVGSRDPCNYERAEIHLTGCPLGMIALNQAFHSLRTRIRDLFPENIDPNAQN